MADKPPPPPPKPKPKPPMPAAPAAPARPTPPLKKPPLAQPPPPMSRPLKPPPAHQFWQQQQQPGGGGRKRRYRNHHRAGGGCSGRRVCCLATGFLLLTLCLALAAACLAYLYYHPRPPSFHLQPLAATRFRVGNTSSAGLPSAMDVTVSVRVVLWNPNDRVSFEYGDGEGRVALADGDGDVALGWAPVAGFRHAARSVATVAFVAVAKGVVVDDAVAARVRDRYRRRQLVFKVVVDTHVGARVGGLRVGMVPVRLLCDGGAMAAPATRGGGTVVGPMSKCQVYLFRVRWFSLN